VTSKTASRPLPLHQPQPLPDRKPSSAPIPIPIPLPPPGAPVAPGEPATRPTQTAVPEAGRPTVAVLGQPIEDACCAQPRPCECPLCLLRRRVTTRFRNMLGGCPCCGCCGGCGCDPPSLAESVAARVRAEEACAPSRLCAVRYLGTVDCHYYPEAEEALIASLRCDRNRCVRQEAACALGSGCCGTPRVIEALTLVVAAREDDGNPRETCDDVRRAAFQSLQKLLASPDADGAASNHVGPVAGMSTAIARARIAMAQVAGTAWVLCAYRCPPPPQRNLADVVVNALRSRHVACATGGGARCAAAADEALAEGRYFPAKPAGISALAATPGTLPLLGDHPEIDCATFALPKSSRSAAGTAAALRVKCAARQCASAPWMPEPCAAAADSADMEVIPVLAPVSATLPARALEPRVRSLLPPGLTPLGAVPEFDAQE